LCANIEQPGPAEYETRGKVFATEGGVGHTKSPKHWSFGTEARTINKQVIRLARENPAPTDYAPKKPRISNVEITFGERLLDILSKRAKNLSPGPARYEMHHHDI